MKTEPMALATGDARRRWLIWMMVDLVGSSARGEGGGNPGLMKMLKDGENGRSA